MTAVAVVAAWGAAGWCSSVAAFVVAEAALAKGAPARSPSFLCPLSVATPHAAERTSHPRRRSGARRHRKLSKREEDPQA